jgi:hypothetical protein
LHETPRQAESEEIQYKDLDKVAVRICNTPQNTGKKIFSAISQNDITTH